MKDGTCLLNRSVIILFTLGFFAVAACGGGDSTSSTTEHTLTLTGAGSLSAALINASPDLRLTTPSSIKIKVYKMAVSTDAQCGDPVTVFEEDDPEYKDFLAGPIFGSGPIAEGTYPCVMFEFSDLLQFTPQADDGPDCVEGTEYTFDICQTDFEASFQLIDGTGGTCEDGEQRVAAYYSTAAANTTTGPTSTANPFLPPDVSSDSDNGLRISALVVTADITKTLVMDATDEVNGVDFDRCVLEAPELLFE